MSTTAKKIEPTVTVKITREAADLVADRFLRRPLSDLYKQLEPWVRQQVKVGMSVMKKDGPAEVDARDDHKYVATVRILRSQVRRLKVVSPILGRTVSEMIDAKLRELLA